MLLLDNKIIQKYVQKNRSMINIFIILLKKKKTKYCPVSLPIIVTTIYISVNRSFGKYILKNELKLFVIIDKNISDNFFE